MKKNRKIFLSESPVKRSSLKYVKRALRQYEFGATGSNLNAFEKRLVNYLSAGYVCGLNSGTSALHLALLLAGVKKDDVVLLPAFTYPATINPVFYTGATPVLIDSEKDSWNMDPGLAEEAISDSISNGKKPGAIILVHIYGMPANM